MILLQVLISTFGQKGIERIAALPHPEVEGVEYIVSWQYGEDSLQAPELLLKRKDFKIIPTSTRGLSVNRNLSLDAATAPIVLLSDDDVAYTREDLAAVIASFDANPDVDYINFKYRSESNPIPQFTKRADLSHPPKWWYTGGTFTIAFRLDVINKHNIRFNTLFGIGAPFPSGEEDILLHDVIKAGLTPIYLPVEIVTHEGTTTSMREHLSDTFISTKGAVFSILFPITWPGRMLTHALRFSKDFNERKRYIHSWLKGRRDYLQIVKGKRL